jgi:hypothetical protein
MSASDQLGDHVKHIMRTVICVVIAARFIGDACLDRQLCISVAENFFRHSQIVEAEISESGEIHMAGCAVPQWQNLRAPGLHFHGWQAGSHEEEQHFAPAPSASCHGSAIMLHR